MHVCHNVSFVVDLHALDDPKDIQADENGVWQRNGSAVTYVSIHGAKVFCHTNMGNHSTTKFHIHTIGILAPQTSGV